MCLYFKEGWEKEIAKLKTDKNGRYIAYKEFIIIKEDEDDNQIKLYTPYTYYHLKFLGEQKSSRVNKRITKIEKDNREIIFGFHFYKNRYKDNTYKRFSIYLKVTIDKKDLVAIGIFNGKGGNRFSIVATRYRIEKEEIERVEKKYGIKINIEKEKI